MGREKVKNLEIVIWSVWLHCILYAQHVLSSISVLLAKCVQLYVCYCHHTERIIQPDAAVCSVLWKTQLEGSDQKMKHVRVEAFGLLHLSPADGASLCVCRVQGSHLWLICCCVYIVSAGSQIKKKKAISHNIIIIQ